MFFTELIVNHNLISSTCFCNHIDTDRLSSHQSKLSFMLEQPLLILIHHWYMEDRDIQWDILTLMYHWQSFEKDMTDCQALICTGRLHPGSLRWNITTFLMLLPFLHHHTGYQLMSLHQSAHISTPSGIDSNWCSLVDVSDFIAGTAGSVGCQDADISLWNCVPEAYHDPIIMGSSLLLLVLP